VCIFVAGAGCALSKEPNGEASILLAAKRKRVRRMVFGAVRVGVMPTSLLLGIISGVVRVAI
jgi:hypothetical protein